MGGQYGQPFEVEEILGLKSSKKDTQNGFFIEAGAGGNLTLVSEFTCGEKRNVFDFFPNRTPYQF